MPDLAVDPDSIQRAATELESAADELDTAVGAFVQALGQVGDPWGLDTLGTLIGGGYVAIEQLALQTLDSIVSGFDWYAEGLAEMAASYRAAEDANTDVFDRFRRQ
jgi:hypothetical protein